MITIRQIEKAAQELLADMGIAAVVSAHVEGGTLHIDIKPEPSREQRQRFAHEIERRHSLIGADVWTGPC